MFPQGQSQGRRRGLCRRLLRTSMGLLSASLLKPQIPKIDFFFFLSFWTNLPNGFRFCCCSCCFGFFVFLGLHPQHMEVPRGLIGAIAAGLH